MAEEFVSIVTDPDKKFAQALKRAKQETADLRIPLTMIAKDWFKTNQVIFKLKGPGQYADLKDSTKKFKKAHFGFVYPILRRGGDLEKSITQPTDSNAINEIINKSQLTLGTKVVYAFFNHYGTKVIPARPVVFFGPEAEGIGQDKTFKVRPTQWLNIINSYVLEKMGTVGEVTTGVKPKA